MLTMKGLQIQQSDFLYFRMQEVNSTINARRSIKFSRMLQWTSENFDGNRFVLNCFYMDNLKQHLRNSNCYKLANGDVVKSNYQPSKRGLQQCTIIVCWRNLIIGRKEPNRPGNHLHECYKNYIDKINQHGREAYLLLQTTYGGALTAAEMAHIENILDTKITKKVTAESSIENW